MMRLETLCAKAEHCVSELADRLYRWGIADTDRSRIIESLIERRFVDNERFAHAYVRDKYRFSRWGRRKILAGLAAKRIDRSIALSALSDEIDPDEYFATLCRLAAAYIGRMATPLDYESTVKLHRRLSAAGYESALITRALKSMSQD